MTKDYRFMISRRHISLVLFIFFLYMVSLRGLSNALLTRGNSFCRLSRIQQPTNSNYISILSAVTVGSIDECNLTPRLDKMTRAFANVPDDKLRYQQLLFLAQKAKPMPAELKTEETKVPGCLSVVHVHARQEEDGTIEYQGDSDSQLTKGIVCLLVNGLSGNTPEEIEAVKPEFIQFAGIGATLTPGRNNGFLNMMMKMKEQARQLSTSSKSSPPSGGAGSEGKVYKSIVSKLSMLKPSELVVEDESHKHAGHAGMIGSDAVESHFNVRIIADCFEGLGLVQRHKMIYTLLDEEMKGGIHALSIYSKTPAEEQSK